MRTDLRIAGYRIRLTEARDCPRIAWPMSPFDRFIDGTDAPSDIALTVTVVQVLPHLPHGPLHFDACHGLWRVYETQAGFLLEALDTTAHQPCSRALITKDFSRADVWTLEEQMGLVRGWVPMKIINPVIEVCLLTKLAREGGLLLHSAGILSRTGGYIFTGASGAGKSTLSGFFDTSGASVLSDERTIIRKSGDAFVVHGTPWVGSGAYAKNESGRVTELFCIRHGPQHHTEAMSPNAALSFILPQCFLPHWDRAAMETTLAFLSDLVLHIPCKSLAFAKNPGVVDFIQNQLAGTSLVTS